VGISAVSPFGAQLIGERFVFLPCVRLQRVEPLAEVFLEV
jgi:hypothetical protein